MPDCSGWLKRGIKMKKVIVFLAVLSLLAGSVFLKGEKIKGHQEHKPGSTTIDNMVSDIPVYAEDKYIKDIFGAGSTTGIISDRMDTVKNTFIPDSLVLHSIYEAGVKLYSGDSSSIDIETKRMPGNYYKGVSYG
jgi:hypothetical protein